MFGAEGEVGVSGRLRKRPGIHDKGSVWTYLDEIVSEEGTGRCRTAQWRGRIRPSGSRLDVTGTT